MGCLWAISGLQKNGLVKKFIRNEEDVTFDRPSPDYDEEDFVPIEVKACSFALMDSNLLHQRIQRKVKPGPLYVSCCRDQRLMNSWRKKLLNKHNGFDILVPY